MLVGSVTASTAVFQVFRSSLAVVILNTLIQYLLLKPCTGWLVKLDALTLVPGRLQTNRNTVATLTIIQFLSILVFPVLFTIILDENW